MFLNFGASLACEKVWGLLSSSAGAIYVRGSFTQSSGTLTITHASAKEDGGVVGLGAPPGLDLEMLFEDAPRAVFQGFTRRAWWTLSAYIAACRICKYSNSIKFPRQFEQWEHLDVPKELCISAAGAIYVEKGSFTQSGGNLTITDASAGSDGGVVHVDWAGFAFQLTRFVIGQGSVASMLSKLSKNTPSRPQVPFTSRREASPSRVARWRSLMHRQGQGQMEVWWECLEIHSCLQCFRLIDGVSALGDFLDLLGKVLSTSNAVHSSLFPDRSWNLTSSP